MMIPPIQIDPTYKLSTKLQVRVRWVRARNIQNAVSLSFRNCVNPGPLYFLYLPPFNLLSCE